MESGAKEVSLEDNIIDKNQKERDDLKPLKPSCPMSEMRGPFSIPDKHIVTMYQEGLAHGHWNPTQVLYEICSQCNWLPPLFVELTYSKYQGFHFAVIVKDVHFVPEERGPTKKIATHLASTHFLQFLGFKFEFEQKQSTEDTCNYSTYFKKEYNYQNQHERKMLRERMRKPTSGESKATSDSSEGTPRLKSSCQRLYRNNEPDSNTRRHRQTRSPTSSSSRSGEESPSCKSSRQRLFRNNKPDSNTGRHRQTRSPTSSSSHSGEKSPPCKSSRQRLYRNNKPDFNTRRHKQTRSPTSSSSPPCKSSRQRLYRNSEPDSNTRRHSQSRRRTSSSCRSSKKSCPWMSSRLRKDGSDEPSCSSWSSSQTRNPANSLLCSSDDFPHWKKCCQRLDDFNQTNMSRGRPSQSKVTTRDSDCSIFHRKSFRSNDTEQYHKTVCTRREHDSLSHHSRSLLEKRYNYPNNTNLCNKKFQVPDHVRKALLDAELDSIRSEMFS